MIIRMIQGKSHQVGIMFHHFHGGIHTPAQGSMTDEQLALMIERLNKHYKVLSADKWFDKAIKGKLGRFDMCLTFDDTLRCQYDIALPVLKKLKLRAFWFVYTSPLQGGFEKLEIYRYFRNNRFKSINEFYGAFDRAILRSPYKDEVEVALEGFKAYEYLHQYYFYSDEDRRFRYIRDVVLGEIRYNEIMDIMIIESRLRLDEKLLNMLWMDSGCISILGKQGHVIGLHSHTHPLDMSKLTAEEQRKEYTQNYKILQGILGEKVYTMSHPSDSYNEDTLGILRGMGILVGFKADNIKEEYTMLEYPRVDCAMLR